MTYLPGHAALSDRMWPRVLAGEPFACWPYAGPDNGAGYGLVSVPGARGYAHRLAYADAWGPIPPGLHVCHDCDYPPCVNPLHLFAGTHAENMQDMAKKGRCGQPAGERHARAKLSDGNVLEIQASDLPGVELARLYGVTPAQICRLRRHGRKKTR